jgi:hypothetical protein
MGTVSKAARFVSRLPLAATHRAVGVRSRQGLPNWNALK